MKRKFIAFLKKNEVLESFNKDIKKFNPMYDSIEKLCANKDKMLYIYSAFPWSNSVHGFDFWDDLNRKWLKEIEK